MVVEITQNDFEEKVLKSKLPVLVDFWAEWCGPCKMLAPTLTTLSEQVEGQALVVKANVDVEQDLANKYEISSIPTLLIFKDGELVDRRSGVVNIKQLKQMLGLDA